MRKKYDKIGFVLHHITRIHTWGSNETANDPPAGVVPANVTGATIAPLEVIAAAVVAGGVGATAVAEVVGAW